MIAEDYITSCLNDVKNIFKQCKNIKQKEELYKIIKNFIEDIDKLRLDFYTEFSATFTYCEGCKQWYPNEEFSTEKYIETYSDREVETFCYVCNKCGTKKTFKTNTTIYINHTNKGEPDAG